ncbi:hypothetical protein QFZ75_008040 [Streptomyces sp. V3I8]|uniref:hypothetical protein n=1 Tax=Streptomyces sp. V3I8 TaxID=3042279 RepID=UPI00277D23FE|nr:hypothetical protein [Streptomyces sp. V3I8]MDQ1041538.1 hypothetical protein [Streptomyces sp. V3I8]
MTQPLTMQDAEAMGVPACFSLEYAFHEGNGTLPPYAGPVYPDFNREDVDYGDPGDNGFPVAEPVKAPALLSFEDLGMPPGFAPHEPGCWDFHSPAVLPCPPPF